MPNLRNSGVNEEPKISDEEKQPKQQADLPDAKQMLEQLDSTAKGGIFVFPSKMNVPETIIAANMCGVQLYENKWYNKFLLEGTEYVQYGDKLFVYTGDYFFYGAMNRPTGKEIKQSFYFNGKEKQIIQQVPAELQTLVNVLFRAKQGFDGNDPLLYFVNAIGNEIKDFEALDKTNEIFVRIKGKFEQVPRPIQMSEKFSDGDQHNLDARLQYTENLGLMVRSSDGFHGYGDRHKVDLCGSPDEQLWVFGTRVADAPEIKVVNENELRLLQEKLPLAQQSLAHLSTIASEQFIEPIRKILNGLGEL